MWGPDATGAIVRLAEASIALPLVPHAQEGEAWGARAALALLVGAPSGPRRARICGDNLGVVRFCATTGRLRRIAMHGPLEGPLADTALAGWDLQWTAVPRRLNEAADAIATCAVMEAARIPAGTPTLKISGL